MQHFSRNNKNLRGGVNNRITTTLKLILIVSLAVVGLSTTLTQALPAVESALTSEIEIINIDSSSALKATIEDLNKVDPQKPTITKLQKKSKGEVTTDTKDKVRGSSTLNISIKSNKTISMDNGRNKINIKVDNHGDSSREETKLVDNKVIYQGTKVDTIVEVVDGGLRQTINIKDSSAPKSYNFPMELQTGQRIIINKDGSANVVNNNNESITTILKPWARDAKNQEIPTYYTVDNNILRQHITTDNMTKYPVKADPTWCGDAVSNVEWVWRSFYGKGAWSLKLKPTWCLNWHAYTPWDAWTELLNKTPYHDRFNWDQRKYGTNKYWSMYNQFACHRDWVKWSNLYNNSRASLPAHIQKYVGKGEPNYREFYHLEPDRSDLGYWGYKDVGCNGNNNELNR
jgi:hypothetical protein